MSRLIDADELIKALKDRATNEAIAGYMTAYDVTNSIIDEVEEQPTAYDVEKVVHELREVTKCNIDCYEGRESEVADYDDSWNDDIISACKAIEIVRKGGIE